MDYHHPAPTDVTALSPAKRNYLKCDDCRSKKRKCEPPDRNWNLGQRCRACEAGNRPCGPNTFYNGSSSNYPSHSSPSPASDPILSSPSFQLPGSFTSPSVPPGAIFQTNDTTSLGREDLWSSFGQYEGYLDSADAAMFPNLAPIQNNRALRSNATIRAKLEELEELCDGYRYLRTRSHASEAAQPTRKLAMYHEINENLLDLLYSTRARFNYVCEQILRDVNDVSNAVEHELFLHCLHTNVGAFAAILNTANKDESSRDIEFERIHRQVTKALLDIFVKLGQSASADRFRLRLAVLCDRHGVAASDSEQALEATAFLNMSARVSEAFESVPLPPRCRRAFTRNQNCFPATHLAAHAGRPMTAHLLLEDNYCQGEDVDILQRGIGHIAVETKNPDLLQACLQQSIGFGSSRDLFGMTPFCLAAQLGDSVSFTMLVDVGADFNVQDHTGRNVLCIACDAGSEDIVEDLLKRCCNPNVQQSLIFEEDSASGYSPLHAAAAGGHKRIVDRLLKCGAWALSDFQGRTPAAEAEYFGHIDLAASLKEHARKEEKQIKKEIRQRKETARTTSKNVLAEAPLDKQITHLPQSSTTYSPPSMPTAVDQQCSSMSSSASTILSLPRVNSPTPAGGSSLQEPSMSQKRDYESPPSTESPSNSSLRNVRPRNLNS